MSNKIHLTLFLILSFVNLSFQEEPEPYFELNDSDFQSFINKNRYVLVNFYSPNSNESRVLSSEYTIAAKRLKSSNSIGKLAKVDVTVAKETALKYNIESYPTLKFFINGEETDYTGTNKRADLVSWVQKRIESHLENEDKELYGDIEKDENVYILTDSNFDDFINKNEYVFVKFMAPWCNHCKKMAPVLKTAANLLRQNLSIVKVAKVDATVENALSNKFNIEGYPTLKLFYKGNPIDYNRGREEKDLVEFLAKTLPNPIELANTVEEIEEARANNDYVVLYFGNKELGTYLSFALSYKYGQYYKFYHTMNKDVLNYYKAKEESITLFKNFDEKRNDMPGKLNISSLKSFIDTKSVPSIIPYSEKTIRFFYSEAGTLNLVFFYKEGNEIYENTLTDIAGKVKGRINVFKNHFESEKEKKLGEDLGVDEDKLPIILLANPKSNKKFRFNYQKVNSNTIKKFLNDYSSGNAQAYIKSQPIPEQIPGQAFVVVGNTFNSIVMDPKKDVLLEFYAPWCGHCKKLEPIYNELASTLQDNPNLIIAKIDATSNEYSSTIRIPGYPTVLFFPASNKSNPIKYEKASETENSVETFIEFLQKHATHKISTGLHFDDIVDDEELTKDL